MSPQPSPPWDSHHAFSHLDCFEPGSFHLHNYKELSCIKRSSAFFRVSKSISKYVAGCFWAGFSGSLSCSPGMVHTLHGACGEREAVQTLQAQTCPMFSLGFLGAPATERKSVNSGAVTQHGDSAYTSFRGAVESFPILFPKDLGDCG